MQFSYFQNGIKNKSKASLVTVEAAVYIIISDKNKDLITNLRKAEDKSVRNVLKKNLGYFCFSGEFKERKNEALIKHSGLICVDFDDLQQLVHFREKLIADPLTHALFVSPSGNGLKVVVKIDPTQHETSFFWLEGYYWQTYGLTMDKACKDVARACFVSYDPDCFYNPESKAPELPAEDVKFDSETGEVFTEKEKLPEDKEKQFKVVEAYVKEVEAKKMDLTADYSHWMIIAFCISTLGENGRELFHRVSAFNENYNRPDADNKFTNAVKTSRFTSPAKFISMCKAAGLLIKPIITAQPARPKDVDIDENSEWQYMDLKYKSLIELEDEQKKSITKYRITEIKNRYYIADKFNEESMTVHLRPFSNFIIKPLFLVMSKIDAKRVIEIENIYGVKKTIDIPSAAFKSQTEFSSFIEGQGNFLFTEEKGKASMFTLLKVKIYEQTMNAEEVKTLGWHKDGIYFFANGGYNGKFQPADNYGILTVKKHAEEGEKEKEGKHYFLPALSDIYRDSDETYENEKKFIYIPRPDVTFESWATQFYKVHKGNGMLGVLFYMSAIFRDVIYNKFKFFPHLFLFGPPGSGKSTLAWSLQALFGIAQGPFMLNAGTPVGFYRTFAVTRNGLVWFDEYANDIDPKRIQSLKGAYDGSGHVKGMMDNSNKTVTTPINSGCVISGQHLPIADVALFKRCTLLQYTETEHSEESKKELKALQELEQKGLSHITGAMMVFRTKVETDFLGEFEKINKEFSPLLTEVNETRIILNTLIAITMYKLTCDKLKYPFTYEELKAYTIKVIRDQNSLISHAKETSVFWDMITFFLSMNQIEEGKDFKIAYVNTVKIFIDGKPVEKEFASTTPIFYLRLARIHPLYQARHRQEYNKNGMDKNSISHYLTSQKAFIGMTPNTRFGDYTSSAYIFNYETLAKEGYDFEKQVEPDVKSSVYPPTPHVSDLFPGGNSENLPEKPPF